MKDGETAKLVTAPFLALFVFANTCLHTTNYALNFISAYFPAPGQCSIHVLLLRYLRFHVE
jgi:hypothetical protein